MKKSTKENLSGFYLALSLLILCGEPTGEKSEAYYFIFYIIAFANLLIAALIFNSTIKTNATTTN